MKMNKFFMLGLAGLAFAACSNEEDAIVGAGDNTSKTMVVSIAGIGANTKALTDGEDKWSKDEDAAAALLNINRITLLFTDNAGKILYAYEDEKPSGEDKNWKGLFGNTGVKFLGMEGVEQVYAIANKSLGTLSTVIGKNVSEYTTDFTKQGGYSVVEAKSGAAYVGWDKTISPYQAEPSPDMPEIGYDNNGVYETTGTTENLQEEGNFYYEAAINLVPTVSRIQINSITIATSGTTTETFPAEKVDLGDGKEIAANKFKLSWSNFKPELQAIYLNNFYTTFNDFSGGLTNQRNNESFLDGTGTATEYYIKDGQWLIDGTNYAEDAAYVAYVAGSDGAQGSYGKLLDYAATPATGNVELVIPDANADDNVETCIAFNVFVPVTVDASGTPQAVATTYNPTIHFQFNKNVANNYDTEVVLADGGAVSSEDDKNWLNAWLPNSTVQIDYTLPNTEAYLFANVNKLYTDAAATTNELQMKPGMIYNMDVIISPVNMTFDLNNPKSYNVVVKVTVQPFGEQTIYPSLGE